MIYSRFASAYHAIRSVHTPQAYIILLDSSPLASYPKGYHTKGISPVPSRNGCHCNTRDLVDKSRVLHGGDGGRQPLRLRLASCVLAAVAARQHPLRTSEHIRGPEKVIYEFFGERRRSEAMQLLRFQRKTISAACGDEARRAVFLTLLTLSWFDSRVIKVEKTGDKPRSLRLCVLAPKSALFEVSSPKSTPPDNLSSIRESSPD